MEYHLKIGDVTEVLDVAHTPGEKEFRVTSEGRDHFVRVEALSPGHYRLAVDGKTLQAFVARCGQEKQIFIGGRVYRVQDEAQAARRRRRGPEAAPGQVTPPMPATVVRIMVSPGQTVKKGQGLVVVSAMKMETTLTAPYPGVVGKINTTVNAKVAPGDILVEIQEEEPADE